MAGDEVRISHARAYRILATGVTVALSAVAIYAVSVGWVAALEERAGFLTILGLTLVSIGAVFIVLALIGGGFTKCLRVVFFLAPGLAAIFGGLAAFSAGYGRSTESGFFSWLPLILSGLSTLAMIVAYVVVLTTYRKHESARHTEKISLRP